MPLFAVTSFLLHYTAFGRLITASGSNQEAVRLSGTSIGWYIFAAYVISGGLSALAGVVNTARSGVDSPVLGIGIELDVIAAVVIGGASLMGGRGTAFNALLGVLILVPIAVMCVWGATKWQHNPFVPLIPPGATPKQVAGVGLALGLWLYSGFEQLSTVAEEVENPQRTFPLALAWVVPMSIATYFLPTLVSLAALGDWHAWKDGYFSDAAFAIGGHWLGFAVNLAALITAVSLLNGTVVASIIVASIRARVANVAFCSREMAWAMVASARRLGAPCSGISVASLISTTALLSSVET